MPNSKFLVVFVWCRSARQRLSSLAGASMYLPFCGGMLLMLLPGCFEVTGREPVLTRRDVKKEGHRAIWRLCSPQPTAHTPTARTSDKRDGRVVVLRRWGGARISFAVSFVARSCCLFSPLLALDPPRNVENSCYISRCAVFLDDIPDEGAPSARRTRRTTSPLELSDVGNGTTGMRAPSGSSSILPVCAVFELADVRLDVPSADGDTAGLGRRKARGGQLQFRVHRNATHRARAWEPKWAREGKVGSVDRSAARPPSSPAPQAPDFPEEWTFLDASACIA